MKFIACGLGEGLTLHDIFSRNPSIDVWTATFTCDLFTFSRRLFIFARIRERESARAERQRVSRFPKVGARWFRPE